MIISQVKGKMKIELRKKTVMSRLETGKSVVCLDTVGTRAIAPGEQFARREKSNKGNGSERKREEVGNKQHLHSTKSSGITV